MRSALVLLAALAVAGALAVVAVAAGDERVVAHAVGLPAIGPAARLAQGEQLCRTGIGVPVGFQRVRVVTITGGRPGPPLAVTVRSRAGRTARARIAGGYPGGTVEARVGAFPAESVVSVCVRNVGVREVVLLGLPPGVLLGDLGDVNVPVEMAVVFVRARPVSTLGQVPAMMRRAALFKPVPAGVLWALLGLVVVGLPALLAASRRGGGAPGAPRTAPPPAARWRRRSASRRAQRRPRSGADMAEGRPGGA